MELPEPRHLWLGGERYVLVDEILSIVGTARTSLVVLRNGKRLHATRGGPALAADLDRFSRLRKLHTIITGNVASGGPGGTLSTGEASGISGYSVETLRAFIRSGAIAASKVAGEWRIDAESLYLWLAEHTS